VAVVAGRAAAQIGITVVSGNGRMLAQADIEALGEQAAREAFGLPAS
jgi:hypothetical protein